MKNFTLSKELFVPSLPAVPSGNFFENATRRAKLVRATRHAFVMWSAASDLLASRQNALRPSEPCIKEAAAAVRVRKLRYLQLETALAEATGLNEYSVFNDIAQFPDCTRLLRAGL